MADRSSFAEQARPFEQYYQAELAYLRETGRAFAGKHPALAGMLAERGGDPDVERLLEGFAFLAARLHQRIDDAVPELTETLAELLLPHVLRTSPATTIVQFRPTAELVRGNQQLSRGSRLLSRPVRGTACRFRTTSNVTLSPLALVSQQLDDASMTRPELRLSFSCTPGTNLSSLGRQPLRLHLHGERATVTQLYMWLARHVSSVSVHEPGGRSVELGSQAFRAAGFDAPDALFPWPSFSPDGPRLLLEYFTLPSKFLFIELTDLERAHHLHTEQFELVVRFNQPPALPARLPDDAVRLHCTPAANLFDISAEPVRVGPTTRPTLLRAAGLDPLHAEVFAVRSVIGLHPTGQSRQYEPFHAFRHATAPEAALPFYKLSRELSPIDDGVHTYIQIHGGTEGPLPQEQALSIELEASNRSLPHELEIDDLCISSPDIPAGVSFTNIARVTKPARPPLGAELNWRFLMHLACMRRSLSDLEVLKNLLCLYCAQAGTDAPGTRANERRIDAIQSVSTSSVTRVLRGAAVLGCLYEIAVFQDRFDSEGDAFLFGSVLHRFLALNERINSFADLSVTLLPSGVVHRFRAELPQ